MAVGDGETARLIVSGCSTVSILGSIPMLYAPILRRRVCVAAMGFASLAGMMAAVWLFATRPRLATEISESVIDIQADPVSNITGLTDEGAAIPLFHIKFLTPESEVQQFIRDLEAQQADVVRLQNMGPECNCHGWVFTGGQFSLRDFEVQALLRDNGYVEVAQPTAGDLIVYWSEESIVHSGVVQRVDENGRAIVASKWGPLGLYRHAPEDQPYSNSFRYFHTERGTHLLKFQWQLRIARAGGR